VPAILRLYNVALLMASLRHSSSVRTH
jgi:hypothetical protein